MGLLKRRREEDHEDVSRKLKQHDEQLAQMARRLRRLEIEAGIVKPPLRGVDHTRIA